MTDRSRFGIGRSVSDAVSVDERVRALEQQLSALVAQFTKVVEERDEYRKLVLHLKEENERLRRGLVGQKAERLPRNMNAVFTLLEGADDAGRVIEPPVPAVRQAS